MAKRRRAFPYLAGGGVDVVGGWVQSISGAGGLGGTIAILASPLQFGATIANPTISQATTPSANAQPLILQPEASSNANGSVAGVRVQNPSPTGSGTFATFQIQEAAGTQNMFQVAVGQGSNTIAYLHLFNPGQGLTPGSGNFLNGMQSGTMQFNVPVSTMWGMVGGSLVASTWVWTSSGFQFFNPGVSPDFGGGVGVLGWSKSNTDPTAAPTAVGNFIGWSSVTDSHLRMWGHGGVKMMIASGDTAVCIADDRFGQVTTTNATQTTILTYGIPSNEGGTFVVLVTARNTTTNHCASTIVIFGAENVAGTVAINGTAQVPLTIANGSNAAMNTVSVAVSASASNFIVQGTGIAATNIQWTAEILRALVA